jgi:hypothetical protein
MAKTVAPLLSFGGSGQIGKTQVYSSWRGVKYARRYVIPANPQSDEQTSTRNVFAWLNGVWKQMSPEVQAVWFLFSKGRPFTDRNSWIAQNLAHLRGTIAVPVTVVTALRASPGANAGLAAAGIATASGGAGALAVTLTAPSLPAGWAVVQAHCLAVIQQDAHESLNYTSYYAFDASAPYVPTFAALPTGTYVVSAFFEFTKPDGSTAYSPSLNATQAVA